MEHGVVQSYIQHGERCPCWQWGLAAFRGKWTVCITLVGRASKLTERGLQMAPKHAELIEEKESRVAEFLIDSHVYS